MKTSLRQIVSAVTRCLMLVVLLSLQATAQEPTARPSPESPSFTFAVVSDLHVSEHEGPRYLKAFVRQIDAMPSRPDLVLVTGDIHVDPFQKVFDEIKPAVPFHVVAGNHESRDARNKLAKMFPNDFKGKDFYSFTYKNAKFIAMCDAASNGDHVGHFESQFIQGERQGQWIEDQLRESRGKFDHVFIFGHIPPSPDGNADQSCLSTNDQKQLREWIEQYRPTALFFGHLHKKMDFKIGPSPVYLLPSLNWNFKPEVQPRGFLLVKVCPKDVTAEFVPLKLE